MDGLIHLQLTKNSQSVNMTSGDLRFHAPFTAIIAGNTINNHHIDFDRNKMFFN